MFRKTILPLMLMTTLLTPLAASAETFPNPVISRNCPAYAGNNPATASEMMISTTPSGAALRRTIWHMTSPVCRKRSGK